MRVWLWVARAGLGFCSACSGNHRAESAQAAPPQIATPAQAPAAAAKPKRLVVLGFDGVDPRWLQRWANEGKLPVLKQLMAQTAGRGFRPLGSTNPPQSPVAWTSFATGTLPGDHGIFDFIARERNTSQTGTPIVLKVATTAFDVQASGPPVARNLRTGTPFWQLLANQGVRVVALNVPYSFPPDPLRDGRMLSGLGVPDLRETNSTFTYAGTDVTPADSAHPPGGGAMVKLTAAKGALHFELEGPSVPGKDGARMKLPVEISRAGAGHGRMNLTLNGTPYSVPLQAWSDWIDVEFAHAGTRVHGELRLLPLEQGKHTRLFVSPISFDPRAPYAPISHPRAFSGGLAEALGHVYKTLGWDHDTSALNAELIDEGAFLADMDSIERDRKTMLMSQLARADFDLLIWVSTATDRVAHMFYRLIDRQHPRYDAQLAERYGSAIEREYQRMDATVGEVLQKLGPDDTLLVLSDHGFHDYRRGLHLNQWLRQLGFLTLKANATSSPREFLIDVDWARTKAYALGTGQIYLNLLGRERDGSVAPSEAPQLLERIRTGLLALRDKQRDDAVVVKNVYLASDVFKGRRAADAPDMQIAFAENYRTSWESILGGVPAELFADNDKKWSGDHAASDVADTPGVVVSNRALASDDPHIVDIAPTAHAFFKKAIPGYYAGKTLLATEPR
jgi:predicted AlkP superfamily phosphohydrolase/phosphomutase